MYRIKSKILFIVLLTNFVYSHADGNMGNISYSIYLNKDNFLPMEPIIVKSKLKNNSNSVIEVNEPSGMAFVVTYDLYSIDPNGRKKVEGKPIGEIPVWHAQIFIIEPNKTCESSWELWNGQVPPGLPVGEYIIKSLYHFGRYGTSRYENNVLFSNEVSFHIEARNADQELVFEEFKKCLDVRDEKLQISNLSAFIEKYPNAPYRQFILGELENYKFRNKDYNGQLLVNQEQLKGEISIGRRERVLYGTAVTFLNLGKTKEAIDILSKGKNPRSLELKEQLEKGQIPREYKEIRENEK